MTGTQQRQIKDRIKRLLLGLGLWYPLNLARTLPAMLRWIRNGCTGSAPGPIKWMVIRSYITRHRIGCFVESGTYAGDTLGYIARSGIRCTSIELSRELFEAACERFRSCGNVRLAQGDSAERIPELLETIHTPALFWLDGHYSAGITAKAKQYTPVSAELKAILGHPIKEHVILIDDAHCFDGTNDYPHLDELLRIIREEGSYVAEVSADIIRLQPRQPAGAGIPLRGNTAVPPRRGDFGGIAQ